MTELEKTIEDIRICWKNTFNSEDGKLVMYMLLERFGYFETNPDKINPRDISHCNFILKNLKALDNEGDYIQALLDLSR